MTLAEWQTASGDDDRSIEDIFPGVSAIISPTEPEERKRQRRRFEIVIRKKSGQSMILGISESPLFERGVKIGSILIFQDLTSFKEMEREGEKNKQLAFIGQMAAGLAHELRTPLQSISGSIQILRRDLKLEPTDERLMQVILRAKDQMESLVRNFLLMARSNLGKRSETDIGRLVEDVIESLTYGAEWNPQVEVRKTLGKDLRVMGDPSEIRQVLWNLMINAMQAMPEGGTLSVTACPERIDGEAPAVRIEIGDTGSGIDPAHLETVGDRHHVVRFFVAGQPADIVLVRAHLESAGGDGHHLERHAAGEVNGCHRARGGRQQHERAQEPEQVSLPRAAAAVPQRAEREPLGTGHTDEECDGEQIGRGGRDRPPGDRGLPGVRSACDQMDEGHKRLTGDEQCGAGEERGPRAV